MKFIALHLGLGDLIITSGLVNFLSKTEKVMIPCWERNYGNVKSFFADNKNVEIRVISGDNEVEHYASQVDSIRVGQFVHNRTEDKGHLHFSELFYSDAGVDYKERYDSCPLLEQSKKLTQFESTNDVFVSNYGSIGLCKLDEKYLSGKKIEYPKLSVPILVYADFLYKAKEIHVIESAFRELVEQLPTTGELFYHKYARPGSGSLPLNIRKKWTVLEA